MDLFIQEKIRQHYPNLTSSQRALCRYILDHTKEVPFLSSALLARKVHVSDASVTRFCMALGYSGYAEFQKDMRRWIQMELAPSEQIKKAPRLKKENIYQRIFELDIQNLQETSNIVSVSKIEEAIRVLSRSERIFVVGLRRAFSLAYLAHNLLRRVFPNSILLDPAQGMFFDPVINVGPKDSLLAISFPRYAKGTLEIARYCQKSGCRIVAITDSILSPLGQISNVILQVKIENSIFFSSYTAAVSLINCLIAGVSQISHKKTIKALKEFETKLPQDDTWIIKRP